MKLKMGADIEELVLFEKSDRRGRFDRGADRKSDRSSDRDGRRGRSPRHSDKEDKKYGGRGKAVREDKKSTKDEKKSSRDDRKFLRDDKKSLKDEKGRKPRNSDKEFVKPRKKQKLGDAGFVSKTSGLDESLIASIKADRDRSKSGKDMINAQKDAEKKRLDSRREKSSKADSFENVGRINIKGEGATKSWYMGQDDNSSHKKEDKNTMNVSKAEKKAIKKENKKRSIDYLQDMSDLVMESFGKRKNRGK